MRTRRLGASRVEASCLGLGCMTMAGDYGPVDEVEAIATIHRAIDLGVNFFDTADIYGQGSNETLVGRGLRHCRGNTLIATKFGAVVTADGQPAINGRPEHARAACEQSLRRLDVEAIDLYYLHRVDPDTPIEETVGAMGELVGQGKVRRIGLCEAAPATIRRAHAVHPLTAVQTEYSLWCRDAEADVLPTCRELGITFVAYSPLGRGFLTGTVKAAPPAGDRRLTFPRFQADNLARNIGLLRPVEDLARMRGCSPAQVAIAWLLNRGTDIIPIPGSKRRRHLEENVAAAEIRLTADEMHQLECGLPVGAAVGERYGPAQIKYLHL